MSAYLVNELKGLVADRKVVVIVGAGVSIAATGNHPVASWMGLLEHGVRQCQKLGRAQRAWVQRKLAALNDRDCELSEILAIASELEARLNASGGEFRRWLRETVGELSAIERGAIEALQDLGAVIATTNYDGLLEEVTGLRPVTWLETARVERVLRGDEQGILHLHGYWEQPESVVLGIRSYEDVRRSEHAQTMQMEIWLRFWAVLHPLRLRWGICKLSKRESSSDSGKQGFRRICPIAAWRSLWGGSGYWCSCTRCCSGAIALR
ncbi:SIR2 family protein [Synechococcus sp. PCC 7336]|uniref:SIR2 family protein n=1 Tax=Synechococcus sp. PCC 7336 TaxID=195250 RepID=UPI000344C97A|nr:SIR2 family protein [Synechococcus sp. PCC 7336]